MKFLKKKTVLQFKSYKDRKMKYRTIILSVLILSCLIGYGIFVGKWGRSYPAHPIVIVFDNDAHCAIDGYAKLTALREQQRKETPYVTTVSCGDFVQGDVVGSLSKGENIVAVMNEVKYDVVTLGNHEFDFGIPQLFKLADSLDASVVSANFCDFRTDSLIFQPYQIVRYGEVDIAYLGLTTTTTATMVAPLTFTDANGQIAYGFSRPTFYQKVQRSIDQARAEGADYVVVLAHLGDSDRGEHPSSVSLIARTTGIDAVLDGHDHRVISDTLVRNRKGNPVLLSSTGCKFQNIGLLTLSSDGKFSTKLVPSAEVEASADVNAFVENIKQKTLEDGRCVVGRSEVNLVADNETDGRLVRYRETNLGDFCTDAFRHVLNTDVAMINGGGIRANLSEGNVTYNDLLSVFPFNNKACTATMTGQQLVDALEFSVSFLPEENGSFMQVSGVKFVADASVPSPVQVDEHHLFAGVGEGQRRVSEVQVWDKVSRQYLPVDLDRTYTLASFDYQIKNLGCAGIFRYATLMEDHLPQDIEVLATYIRRVLGGRIGKRYMQADGRMTIK